jgi:hypothetical protein
MRLLLTALLIAVPITLSLCPFTRSADRPGAGTPPATLGVATCASAACHHGNGDLGTKGSEYSTWIAVDPHARAYQALFNADSRRIQTNLGGGKAHENPLCLQCHGMGAGLPRSIQADGVGCEQCHGPAEKWKATHFLPGFDGKKTPGFVYLRDLTTRADTCTKCHVGDATREVNHDLIAAGHPRLKFEFAAYYANYPRHWTYREREERERHPDQEARLWAIGQAATARASLELLASRAERAEKGSWPEFSEYDCAACHHDLRDEEARRERVKRMKARGLKPGDLPWGDWYHGLAKADAAGELKTRYATLAQAMGRRLPDARKVAAEARAAAGLLREQQKAAASAEYPPDAVERLIGALSRRRDLVEEGWDGAAQVYLGLAALNAARPDPAARGKELAAVRKALRESYRDGARLLYELPSRYDAKKVLPLLKPFE